MRVPIMQSELWLQGQALARTGQVIYGGEAKVLDASVGVSSVLRPSVGCESAASKNQSDQHVHGLQLHSSSRW